MEASGIWEPYFKPTARVHSSGFRCFECGYLQIGDKNKAVKKVVIATGVDHIMNFEWPGRPQEIHLDLLKSGEIRIFNNVKRPYWSILGFPTLISRQLKKTPGLGMKILMKSGKSKRKNQKMSEADTGDSRKVLTLLNVYMEYPVAKLLGDDHYYMFKHGSLHGLFHLADEKVVNLLAINNSKIHNGQFVKFIELLEKFTRDNNLKLVIGEIFNKRLDKWFERRGYVKDRDNRVYRELA